MAARPNEKRKKVILSISQIERILQNAQDYMDSDGFWTQVHSFKSEVQDVNGEDRCEIFEIAWYCLRWGLRAVDAGFVECIYDANDKLISHAMPQEVRATHIAGYAKDRRTQYTRAKALNPWL